MIALKLGKPPTVLSIEQSLVLIRPIVVKRSSLPEPEIQEVELSIKEKEESPTKVSTSLWKVSNVVTLPCTVVTRLHTLVLIQLTQVPRVLPEAGTEVQVPAEQEVLTPAVELRALRSQSLTTKSSRISTKVEVPGVSPEK